jgi:hypothetical protein
MLYLYNIAYILYILYCVYIYIIVRSICFPPFPTKRAPLCSRSVAYQPSVLRFDLRRVLQPEPLRGHTTELSATFDLRAALRPMS